MKRLKKGVALEFLLRQQISHILLAGRYLKWHTRNDLDSLVSQTARFFWIVGPEPDAAHPEIL
jgi:hypothetical protein